MNNLAACKSRINSTVVILALLQYQSSTGYDSIDSKDTVFYFDKGNCNNKKEKEMRRRQAASRYPLIIFLKNRTIIIISYLKENCTILKARMSPRRVTVVASL